MMRARQGFTLIEVLVALTITALIGASLTGVLINQSRFYDQQEKLSSARQVSTSAINILMAELRMVETTGGIVSASPTSITVDVPVATGLFCDASSTNTHVLLLPADSTILNRTTITRWAYRTSLAQNAGYAYLPYGETTGSSNRCGLGYANFTAWPDAQLRRLTPALSPAPPVGVPIMLLHRVTYSFAASTSVAGSLALWRQAGSEDPEELVAPFDANARFEFFVAGSQVPQATPPSDVTTLRGLRLVLDARSERPGAGGTDNDLVNVRTAVFFRNAQ